MLYDMLLKHIKDYMVCDMCGVWKRIVCNVSGVTDDELLHLYSESVGTFVGYTWRIIYAGQGKFFPFFTTKYLHDIQNFVYTFMRGN